MAKTKNTSTLEDLLLGKASLKKQFPFELGKHLEPEDLSYIHHALLSVFALEKDDTIQEQKALVRLCKICKIHTAINPDIKWPKIERCGEGERERRIELPDLGDKKLNLQQCHDAILFYDGLDKFHIDYIVRSQGQDLCAQDLLRFVEKHHLKEFDLAGFRKRMRKVISGEIK